MSETAELSCREVADFIAEYLDGTLAPPVAIAFRRHLSVCPSCVRYIESYQATIRLSKESARPTHEPARGVAPEGIIAAIRDAKKHNM